MVALLVLAGLTRHAGCAEHAGYAERAGCAEQAGCAQDSGGAVRAAGPATHWATVPSLPARPGEHPLHGIVSRLAPGSEVTCAAPDEVDYPRDLDPGHFRAAPLPAGAHVLLVDDTWARGGHAQSAVLALRAAGAARVSVSWPPAGSTRTSAATRPSSAGSPTATTTRRSAPGPAPPARVRAWRYELRL